MRNSIVLPLLCVLISSICTSQTTLIESDSLIQYSFKDLATKYEDIRNTNPEVAEIYLSKLYDIAKNKKEKITVFLKRAHYEILHGTKEKALLYIESAYNLAKDNEKTKLAYVYEKKGYYYYHKEQDYDKALNYYLKALAIAEEKQDKTLLIKIEHKIGALYYALEEYEKALEKYNSLYKKLDTDSIPYNLKIAILKSLGNTYLRKYSLYTEQKKLLDSSSFFTQRGLQLAIQKKDQKAIAFFEHLSGISSFITEHYPEALTHFNSSLKAYEIIKVPRMIQDIYFYKGKTFLKLKQLDSAIYYIKKSEPFLENFSKKLNRASTYILLSECYEQKGDLNKAKEYAEQAFVYKEKLLSENKQVKASIDQNYTLPKLKKRIDKLEEALQNTSRKKTGWYIFSLILIIVLILGYLFFRIREQKNKNSFQKLLEEIKEHNASPVKKVIPEAQAQQILNALEKFENDNLFLEQDCTLPFLARKLNTNTAYLSNIINVYKDQSYTTYIKKLRIHYSIKRLKDDSRFRAYTIESIAKECGFKTAKPFSRAFKKITNIYPSTFIKNLNKIDNQTNS